jgi:hypothetical protein
MSQTHQKKVTTKVFAQTVGCQDATIRRSYCVNGHYLGLRPTKLPNGRLLWNFDKIVKIVEG